MGTKGETIIGGWNCINKSLGKVYQVYTRTVDEVRVWNHKCLPLKSLISIVT